MTTLVKNKLKKYEKFTYQDDNYQEFRDWFVHVPQDRLRNKIVILEVLETLLSSLDHDVDLAVRKASAQVLAVMILRGYFNKEDVDDKRMLKIFLDGLRNDQDRSVCQVMAGALNALIVKGLVSKDEFDRNQVLKIVLKELNNPLGSVAVKGNVNELIAGPYVTREDVKEKHMVKAFLDGLTCQESWHLRKGNVCALSALINNKFITKDDLVKNDVLDIFLQGLVRDPDWEVRVSFAEGLIALISGGFIMDMDIKDRNLVQVLLKGFCADSFTVVREANRHVLDKLIEVKMALKKDVINLIAQNNVVQSLLSCFESDEYCGMRQWSMDAITTLIDKGFLSKNDVIKEIKKKRILEYLLSSLDFDTDWSLRKVNHAVIKAMLSHGLVHEKEIGGKFIDPGQYRTNECLTLENISSGLMRDPDVKQRVLYLDVLEGLIVKGNLTKKEIRVNEIVEILLRGLSTDLSVIVRKKIAGILIFLIEKEYLSAVDIKDMKFVEILLNGICEDPDSDVRKLNIEILKALMINDCISKEDGLIRSDLDETFGKVYGKAYPIPGYLNYLKALVLLKDYPFFAYKLSYWKEHELEDLFSLIKSFNKGQMVHKRFMIKEDIKNLIEMELSKDNFNLFDDPRAFLLNVKNRLKIMVKDTAIKIGIRVYEIAAVNAAKGLIKAIGLDRDKIVILCDEEISIEKASIFFPGYQVLPYQGFDMKGVMRVEFLNSGRITIETSGDDLSVMLPYSLFKYNLPPRNMVQLNEIREGLGIGSRQVIVLGSPLEEELNEFIDIYNSLYGRLEVLKRPLLIIGFRQKRDEHDLRLMATLSGQSINFRHDATLPLPHVKDKNVLIINTMGELFGFYGLAAVAVVGYDRNIFEPASQLAPILYFDGQWANNLEGKDALVQAKAAMVFNRANLEKVLNDQKEAQRMSRQGSMVVEAYRDKIYSKTDEFISLFIGADQGLLANYLG